MTEERNLDLENETLREYVKKQSVYQRNIDNVPKEELLGRYKTAFMKLKNELKEAGITYCFKTIIEYLYIDNSNEGKEVLKKAVQLLSENQKNLIPLVFAGDVKNLDNELLKIRGEFVEKFWGPYSRSISANFKTEAVMQAG